MHTIHPTAIIDDRVELADGVSIGAYSILKGPVKIGLRTVVQEHCNIQGNTIVGADCKIFPGALVGLPPQHLKADPEIGWLVVGDGVTVRETATLHRSASTGIDHATRVGDRCYLMASAHVAHDCQIEQDVILANAVLLAGHVKVARNAFVGGGAEIHQFCRVGRLAIVAGNEGISHDVPPFSAVRYGALKGYNAIGCRRSGMSNEAIHALRAAFYRIQNFRVVRDALSAIRREVRDTPEVRELLDFITASKRGILPSFNMRRRRDRGGTEEEVGFQEM
jgi:UDP-N-acetylglucosamine acyltransferase